MNCLTRLAATCAACVAPPCAHPSRMAGGEARYIVEWAMSLLGHEPPTAHCGVTAASLQVADIRARPKLA
jgi:hypothetical protein